MSQAGVFVIVGGGPAGVAAARIVADARWLVRPAATVWHGQDRTLWVETDAGIESLIFARLLLCANEPLLLAALGCAFSAGVPVVNGQGETSVAGIFAAGRILCASTPESAAEQGRIAARAMMGLKRDGEAIVARQDEPISREPRRDPVAMAELLEQPPGHARNRAALAQMAWIGPPLPARPVSFARLAAFGGAIAEPRPVQQDSKSLA